MGLEFASKLSCMCTVQLKTLMVSYRLAFLLLTWRLFGNKWTSDRCHLHHGRRAVLACIDAVYVLVV